QGEIEVTATQMASIYAAVAADGDIPAPRILLSDEPSVWKEDVVSAENREFLRQALRATVEETHRQTAYRDFATLAGKSGTVEAAWDAQMERISLDSWFIGFDLGQTDMVIAIQEQNVHKSPDRPSAARRFGEVYDLLYQGDSVDNEVSSGE
ncbi:MAG: penicillin-binding transpeptidase domain-containing protein, partial [Eubacteriales bacterium]|nr:penicillin-binding transpeptidase domain-containing protein [Eubacteriales bacterium]